MFSLSGNSASLHHNQFPTIDLRDGEWEIGFVSLSMYNTIPNIIEGENDSFSYKKTSDNLKTIHIPTGSYEFNDIAQYLQESLKEDNVKLTLSANNNTLKTELFCDVEVDLSAQDSIASVMGFDHALFESNKRHSSTAQININAVNTVRVTCNIARGSYSNGVEGHVLYEFYPTVPPGYRIIERPSIVIYLPVIACELDHLKVELIDQTGRLLNTRNEECSVCLHLRRRQ